MHEHSAGHDQFAAPGARRRRRQSRCQRGGDAEHRNADPDRFPFRQRLDAEQGADHHGVQRQRRQRERGARRGRVGHRDVVENEEHAEETEAEGGDGGPVAAARPSRLQQQRRRQHATKADRPAQNRKRNRIGVAGEIARDRRRSPAEATRDQRDRDPNPFAHAVSPHLTRHRLQRLAEHMIATDRSASKKRLSRESFCLMAATVSMAQLSAAHSSQAGPRRHLAHTTMPGVTCRRGNRSLPVKWRSHSSAARFSVERAHGWNDTRTDAVSSRDLCRRAGRRSLRLRLRPRRLGDLALHPHPAANGDADHRIRTARAGLFGLEAARRAGLATALAVRGRRRARRSRRRRHPDLGEPRPCAHGRRRLPGALQPLRAAAAGHSCGESRRCRGRCRL